MQQVDGRAQAEPMVGPVMVSVAEVARMLACSTRTVYRLVDAGRIPRPVRLGGMLRWVRGSFEQWIAQGCPVPGPPKSRPNQVAGSS